MSAMGTSHEERAPARRPRRDDGGYTLIEIVITIALLAVVVVPILNAVITSVEASSRSRSAAQVETMVVNAADRVNRAPKVCDYYSYARAAVVSRGWDESSVSLFQQAYYQPSLSGPAQVDLSVAGDWVFGSSACRLDEPSELEVQLVRIQITSPDGKVSRTIEVVKSDV
jgi:prepilin-type N-terminal cleavage/methylation domain-containing protein